MKVSIVARTEILTYLVNGPEGPEIKGIEVAEIFKLHDRFAAGDLEMSDEEQCLALIAGDFLHNGPGDIIAVGASACTDDLVQ